MLVCTPSRKVHLTLDQKRIIRRYRDDHINVSHAIIAEHFSLEWNIRLVRSTVSGILRADDDNFTICRSLGAKRIRNVEYPHLEEALYLFCCNVKAHNIPISDMVLLKQIEFHYSSILINHPKYKVTN